MDGYFQPQVRRQAGRRLWLWMESRPKRVVIYMYPSMEALQAWRNDPDYVQVRRIGEKYAKYHTFAVEGPSP